MAGSRAWTNPGALHVHGICACLFTSRTGGDFAASSPHFVSFSDRERASQMPPGKLKTQRLKSRLETISAQTNQEGLSEMVKHLGRENKLPRLTVFLQQLPRGVVWWYHQNASPAAARAGETSADGEQDLIQHVTAGCTLSRDPRQAENIPLVSAAYQIRAVKDSVETAAVSRGRSLWLVCRFLYLRRTRRSAGGHGDQHPATCSISRFLENLGPGMNPGVEGRMIKTHRDTISLRSLLQPKRDRDF